MATLIAKRKPYPAYKASGAEWLGDVPAHWNIRRVKWIADLNPNSTKERTSLSADTPVTFLPMGRVGTEGQIDTREKVEASQVWNGYTYFRRGDILVAKITPCFENGKGAYLNSLPTEVGFGSTEFHVLRSKPSVHHLFLYRITTDFAFRQRGTESMTGAAGQQRVSADFVADYQVSLPPLDEQAAIAAFLDRETAKIDALVSKKEHLIELLQEKRTALISRTVTKGLDPNAPMKHSGVEWVGDVPAHWEVARLKSHVANVTDQTDGCGAEEIYLALENVESWTGKLREVGKDISFDSQVKRFQVGDVLFGKLRPYLAKVTSPNCNGVSVSEFLVLRGRIASLMPKYLKYLLLSRPTIDAINSATFGAKMPRADWQFMGGMIQPFPPLAEQRAIAAFLDQETADLDNLIAKIQRAIELLKELRTALISAAVTGQIDVREEPVCT